MRDVRILPNDVFVGLRELLVEIVALSVVLAFEVLPNLADRARQFRLEHVRTVVAGARPENQRGLLEIFELLLLLFAQLVDVHAQLFGRLFGRGARERFAVGFVLRLEQETLDVRDELLPLGVLVVLVGETTLVHEHVALERRELPFDFFGFVLR